MYISQSLSYYKRNILVRIHGQKGQQNCEEMAVKKSARYSQSSLKSSRSPLQREPPYKGRNRVRSSPYLSKWVLKYLDPRTQAETISPQIEPITLPQSFGRYPFICGDLKRRKFCTRCSFHLDCRQIGVLPVLEVPAGLFPLFRNPSQRASFTW